MLSSTYLRAFRTSSEIFPAVDLALNGVNTADACLLTNGREQERLLDNFYSRVRNEI
jgi:hypothetical protein